MGKWTKERVETELLSMGFEQSSIVRKGIDHGIQLTLPEGTILNVYDTGKVVVQGKSSAEKKLAETRFKDGKPTPVAGAPALGAAPPVTSTKRPEKVFVIYGHDTDARNELELLLLRLNIKPVILSNVAPDGKTIIEALIAESDVHYAVVLLTPDDQGHAKGKVEQIRFRARQNVVLEMGMFLMKLGRERVAILHKGNIELPSDINGLIYIPFSDRIAEAKNKLAAALQKAGFYIAVEALSAE